MIKKNRKPKKRTTFIKLFARNAVIGLLLTAVFAGVLFSAGKKYIFSQARSELYQKINSLQTSVSATDNMQSRSKESLISSLRFSANYNITLSADFQIAPDYTENCTALVAITDEKGNILYSSRKGLQAIIRLNEEEEKESMLCNTEALSIPELTQLEEDYYAMKNKETPDTYVHFNLLSAYVNSEKNSFIPHEAELNLIRFDPKGKKEDEVIETKQYNITMPDKENYILIEFNQSDSSSNYPIAVLDGFFGTDKYHFDELIHDKTIQQSVIPSQNLSIGFGTYEISSTVDIHHSTSNIWLDGERNFLVVIFKVDAWNSVTKPLYFRIVAIFLIIVLFIAFLDSWRRNVKNQAEYAFADYQKALTNHLAHDLKTPLMAISGYTENLIENKLSTTEKNKYLQSILNNIAYTDSIISRTLELNNMHELNSLKKEKIHVLSLVEQISEKY